MIGVFKSLIPNKISNPTVLTIYGLLHKISRVSARTITSHRAINTAILSDPSQSPLKAPLGYIENQREWSDVKIGRGKNATMQKSGCGVFAVYNALHALKKEVSMEVLLDLIAYFEKNGLALNGRLGISPKAIFRYFQRNGFEVHMTGEKSPVIINKIGADYEVVIVTAYNDKTDITQRIHTVCITKNERGEYFAHNAFYRKGNQYVAMPEGEKGFATLQEAVEHLSKNPSLLCLIGIRNSQPPV